ncbi:MAG: hypothetical protein C4342_01810 [Armatimonadota bacterium]
MSDTEKIFEEFERAADQMQEAAALLKVRLPALKKAMRAADAATAETDALRRSHAEALERIDQFASALSEIEGAIKKSMASAQKALHDHGIPVDERARLLDFARAVFEPLATSGFEVIIPALGEAIDHERHTVKGSVKSELSGSQVADIISWGHHFPSGDQRTAEVLVGDGSLVEREAEEVEPPAKREGRHFDGNSRRGAEEDAEDAQRPQRQRRSLRAPGGSRAQEPRRQRVAWHDAYRGLQTHTQRFAPTAC